MAQVNIETFREFVAAWERGDTDAALRLTHPDGTFEPLRAQIQGAYRGHAGVRAFWADTAENFESFHLDYTDIRDLGDDRVLAIGTIYVRGKGSGVETDIPTAGDRHLPPGVAHPLEGLRRETNGPPSRRAAGVGMSQRERGAALQIAQRVLGSAHILVQPIRRETWKRPRRGLT